MVCETLLRCRRGRHARRGLTLLELVLVMAILIALAGILVPLFPNMIARASTSSGATNQNEITKIVQLFQALYRGYPNNLDGMTTTVVGVTGLASYVPDSTTTPTLTAQTLTTQAGDLAALQAAGITQVCTMVESGAGAPDWNPTFVPYAVDPPVPVPLAGATEVAYLTAAAATRLFAITPATSGPTSGYLTCVVLGLGRNSTANGTVIDDAPVAVSTTWADNPDTKYCRFGLVFQVEDANGVLPTALFLGAVQFTENGVITLDDNLALNYTLK